MARLLNCKVCLGKVSSDALFCPHCGTHNFKNDDIINIEKKEQEQLLANAQKDFVNEYGSIVYISLHGINIPKPTVWQRRVSHCDFSIDGRILDSEEIGFNYKLKAGIHTVSMQYKTGNHVDPKTSLSFSTTFDTREIAIFYKRANLIAKAHYTLDRVEVYSNIKTI